MPEKANNNQPEEKNEGETDVKIEREITQTDKLNKRLLVSCLQLINSGAGQSLSNFSAELQSSTNIPQDQLDELNN